MQTMIKFHRSDPQIKLIVVLPAEHLNTWKELCEKFGFAMTHHIVTGGDTRYQSVKNGIAATGTDGMVAVHDGVRPLISTGFISRLFEHASKHGNAVPAVAVNESLRTIDGDGSRAVDRSRFRIIQTPQVFLIQALKKAFELPYQTFFTDEASIMETTGTVISLCEGEISNIKITTSSDLAYAESVWE